MFRRPLSDKGVASALESCQSNTRVKRMAMFGLRALSELCTPPKGQYIENALDALGRGAMTTVGEITSNMPDDEEIIELSTKLCWGVVCGLDRYRDRNEINRFTGDNGVNVVSTCLTHLPNDDVLIVMALEIIDILLRLNILLESTCVSMVTLKAIQCGKLQVNAVLKAIVALQSLASMGDENRRVLKDAGTDSAIITYISNLDHNSDPSVQEALYQGLKAVGEICRGSETSVSVVVATKRLIDENKNRKRIFTAGSEALETMVSPDQLSKALRDLSNPSNSEEQKNALDFISAISNIPHFCTQIVECGTIPLLVQGVQSSYEQLSDQNIDQHFMDGLIGSINILGHISRNSVYAEQVYNVGGVTAIVNILGIVVEPAPDTAFAACCSALAAVALNEAYAVELYNTSDVLSTVVMVLYNCSEVEHVRRATLEVLESFSLHKPLHQPLIDAFTFEIVSYSLQYSTTQLTVEFSAVNTLNCLLPHVTTATSIYEYGGFQGFSVALTVNQADKDFCLLTMSVLAGLVLVEDAKSCISDGVLVDAVLLAMLQHQSSVQVYDKGVEILQEIATEKDVERHRLSLNGALNNAYARPEDALMALAGICGLCRVQRLSKFFTQGGVIECIIEHFKRLCNDPKAFTTTTPYTGDVSAATLLDKFLRAEIGAVEAILLASIQPIDDNICKVFEMVVNKQLMSVAPNGEETLRFIYESLLRIAEADRLCEKEAISKAIDCCLDGLKVFSSLRCISEIILNILKFLSTSGHTTGGDICVQKRVHKVVMAYIKSHMYSLQTQLYGLQVIRNLLNGRPELREQLQSIGTVDTINVILRTYTREADIRFVASYILSQLITPDEMSEYVSRNCAIIRDAIEAKDFKNLLVSLRVLTDFAVCPQGYKAVVDHGVLEHLRHIENLDLSGSDNIELVGTITQLINVISSKPTGQASIVKEGVLNILLKCVKDLSDSGDEQGMLNGLYAIRNILEGQNELVSSRMKQQIVNLSLQIARDYPHNSNVTTGVSYVLGALSRSPEDVSLITSHDLFQPFLQQLNDDMLNSSNPVMIENTVNSLVNLLSFQDRTLNELVARQGFIPTLIHILDAYPESPQLTKTSAEALELIGRDNFVKLREFWENSFAGREAKVSDLCGTFQRCIQASMPHEVTLTPLIQCFTKFSTSDDSQVIKDTGLLRVVAEVSGLYPDSEDLNNACSELVQRVSSDVLIQQYIEQLLNADAQGDMVQMDDALEQLNVLFLSPLENPDECLSNEEKIWDVLSRRLQNARDEGKIKTVRNCVTLAHRLVEQGKTDPNGYRGPWYFSQYMVPSFVDMIDTGGPIMEQRRVVLPMMSALSVATSNPNTREYCLESLPIAKIMDLLENNLNDVLMTTALINLLQNIAATDEGVKKIRSQKKDIVPLLSKTMRAHRDRACIVVPASNLLASCCKPSLGPTSPALKNGEALWTAQRIIEENDVANPALKPCMFNVLEEAIQNPEIRPVVLREDFLPKCLQHYESINDLDHDDDMGIRRNIGSRIPQLTGEGLSTQLALLNMLEGYATAGEGVYLRQKNVTPKLVAMADLYETGTPEKAKALEVLGVLSETDRQLRDNELMDIVIPNTFPWIEDSSGQFVSGDDSTASVGRLDISPYMDSTSPNRKTAFAVLKMLEGAKGQTRCIGGTSISGDEFVQLPRTKRLLESIKMYAEEQGYPDLLMATQKLSADVDQSTASSLVPPDTQDDKAISTPQKIPDAQDVNELTLKQVHDWLKERVERNLRIDITDDTEPLLYEYCSFVLTRLTDYDALKLTYDDFAGYQSQWGCKAWELWLTYSPEIIHTLIEWNAHALLLNYLIKQQLNVAHSGDNEVVIATPPSSTLAAFGYIRDPGATTLASYPRIVDICLRNLEICLADEKAYADEHFVPRLSLIEATAIDRVMYQDPKVIELFLQVWDLYDNETLTSLSLIHMFRAFRRVICDDHMDFILEMNVIPRLIDELKKDFNNTLLIHGFFLLGVLGSHNRPKTIIGDSGGIEMSLVVLNNHMNDPPGQGVVVNVQLALANIVLGHKKNCNRFYQLDGLQSNVRVLNERGEHFDETNAAAALLTNVCFKRDDLKELYGSPVVGAPASLSYAISCYDGGTDKASLRCLTNIFKAISNMSLYTPNVQLFLQCGLENAYTSLLEQSEGLPDDVVKTALFTLSNLTWENQTDNMQRFGTIIPPLIKTIVQEHRKDPVLMVSSFEVLSSLCRLKENSILFVECGGIDLSVNLIKIHGPRSSCVLTQAVSCLGVVAREPATLPYFNMEDLFLVLKAVVEGAYFSDDDTPIAQAEAATATLRTIRRILSIGGIEYVSHFAQIGFTDTLVWYLSSLAEMEDPYIQVVVEAVRLLIGLIALSGGDDPTVQVDIDDFVQENILSLASTKNKSWFSRRSSVIESADTLQIREKPEGLRPHDVAGLDASKSAEITSALLRLACLSTTQKKMSLTRLILAWFAYIASENIPLVEQVFFTNGVMYGTCLRGFFEEYGLFPELIIYTVYCLSALALDNPEEVCETFTNSSILYKLLLELARQIPRSKNDALLMKMKGFFDLFTNAWKEVHNLRQPVPAFSPLTTYNVNLALSKWAADVYPNGVHDLSIKNELREGGMFHIVVDERISKLFLWKSNQTLSSLQWSIEDQKEAPKDTKIDNFNTAILVTKISCIVKGLANDLLRAAAKKQRGVSSEVSFLIEGSPCEDYPSGFNFALWCKNKTERDNFVNWIMEWKEAISS